MAWAGLGGTAVPCSASECRQKPLLVSEVRHRRSSSVSEGPSSWGLVETTRPRSKGEVGRPSRNVLALSHVSDGSAEARVAEAEAVRRGRILIVF